MRATEILLVDDNPADADLTTEALASSGWTPRIHAVTDGTEAMSFLHQKGRYANALPPDFVILDLEMPKMNGHAVLAEVKGDPALRKIPIAIFSTSEAPRDIAHSYELGANCYVSKPGNLQEYMSAVKSIEEFWFGLARLPREDKG